MFCSVKGKISTHQKSAVIYTIKRPRCGEENVGKTERCAITRLNELSNCSHQPMFEHLQHCTEVQKDDESIIKVSIRLPYLGNKGEELVKTCIRKLTGCLKTNVKFFILFI